MQNVHSEPGHRVRGTANVYYLKRIFHWSGFCEVERCLNAVDNLQQLRYFSFFRAISNSDQATNGRVQFVCNVKTNCCDARKPLFPDHSCKQEKGLLKFCTDLRNNTNLNISCSERLDKVRNGLLLSRVIYLILTRRSSSTN